MADPTPGTAPVVDHRTPPRGMLPRHTQTWLMGALALGILAIIVVTGRPQPATREAAPTGTPLAPSPDRLREYQDRLRALETRARQQPVTEAPAPVRSVPVEEQPRPPAPPDPTEADRKRREYDSLFASNVVLSRRPDTQRLSSGEAPARPSRTSATTGDGLPTMPSLDEVTDAVVRATTRHTTPPLPGIASPPPTATSPAVSREPAETSTPAVPRAAATPPIRSTDALHRIVEGTVIDTVLTNRLEGSAAAPVNCLVTNAVYSHDGQVVLIPAGARVLGQTKPVQAFGETRLAVVFTRLVMPDGRTYPLDHFLGLNAIGDGGLRDQVDQHYRTTFGASAAIGLLSGFGQFLAGAGLTRGNTDRPIVIAGGVSDTTTQATAQTMNRFLNRLPTVTIREGHRVKVYLTSDLELPAYARGDSRRPELLAHQQ
jgi:type IV secretory pathway VirB10-like protein